MDKINVNLSLTPDELLLLAAFLARPVPVPAETSSAADILKKPDLVNPAETSKGADTAEPEPAYTTMPAEQEKPEPTVTKADLRALGVKLTKAGKTDDLKRAFSTFGAAKLGEVKEADYPALKKVLEDLING